MATAADNTIIASNDTAAHFRAWCTFIHNAFLLGFLSGSDTGQVDLTSVAAPSSTQQVMGYKIYKTNDGLTQVFVKVEYGSGSPAIVPSVWITVSTSTNGAGGMTGVVLLNRVQLYPTSSDIVTQHPCFASGDTSRVCWAIFLATASYPMWFSLERRKDSTIADVNTGVIIDWGSYNAKANSLCAPFSGVIPVAELGLGFLLSSNNPAVYGSTIPEGLRVPFLGPTEPPGRNLAICSQNDYGNYATPTLTINVTNHTFKHLGPYINTLRNGVGGPFDAATRLMMRYE